MNDEEWTIFNDFPKYEVSNAGVIINRYTEKEVRHSLTQAGQVKVGLVDTSGKQRTVLVKNLVARGFVEGRDEIFNTVISLDGDQTNVHYTNLVWRPRWFALQWARQQTRLQGGEKGYYFMHRVVDLDTGEYYDHPVDASRHTGDAPGEILVGCHNHERVWPSMHRYRYVIDSRLGEIGTEEEFTQINFDYQNLRIGD